MASGAESDHSMTWEDFFGSSTDLSPSILGMYDSLLGPKSSHSSSSLSGKAKTFQHQSPAVSQKKSQTSVKMESVEKNSIVKSIPGGVKLPAMTEKPLLRQVLTPSKRENYEPPVEIIPKRAEQIERTVDNSREDQNNFTYLSPNVKRMLSSHSPVMQPKKASTLGSHGRSSTRHKQSNIPLIGATSKITQSSIEIYDTPKPREAVYDIPSPVRRVKPDMLPKAMQELPLPVKFDSSMSGRRLKDMQISPSKSPYLNMMLAVKNVAGCDDAAGEGSSKRNGGMPAGLSVPQIDITRPLSTSSIASSSSGSSCSGNRAKEGVNSAYMASIESLDDQSESDTFRRTKDRIERSETDCGSTIDEGPPRHLEMVCEEIVATEQVYVEDLRQVIEGYLYTWRETAAFDENQLHQVFSNVEDIYKVNRSFLERLDTCNFDPVKISKAFVDLNQHFSVYGDYCTAYPETIRALTNMMKDAASVQIFREQQAKMGHLLPLGSYLLKPVQRILKYHLLLQNLVKYCECEETLEALNIMTLMARHINDMKRKHEHAVRVQEIQSLLLGWSGPDLTTYGELCAEGTFRVFGFKAMRHAFLFDKMLLLTKHRDDGILAYKSHIMCNNLMLVESITGSPLSFHVIPWDSPRAQLTLQASSIVQKREWTLLLKRVILENYQAEIPSHARQLVMQLGQNKTDDDMIAEKSMTYSSMRKQLSAPEYLEKRKMERERRKKSTRKTTTATPAEFQAAIDLCSECRDPASTQHCQPDRYTSNSTVDLNDDKYGGCVCSMDSDFGSSQESFSTNNTTDKMADSCENFQGNIEAKTCLKCLEITENIADSYNWRNHRCRHAHTLEPQKTRSKSKEDFHRSKLPKIGTWRRKSEPGLDNVKADLFGEEREGRYCSRCDKILVCKNCGDHVINMYNSKHLPKKIYQIKKKRIAQGSTAKFYADFNEVLHISESTDSLNTISKDVESVKNEDLDYLNVIQIQKTDSFKKSELEKSKTVKNEERPLEEKPLEQIISQLLMENREFQQILKRHQQRNARRHQRLLKSHSDPEKILVGREAIKRQTSAVETTNTDEHIYETLRVEETKEDPRGDYVRVSVYESDYVYLHFDDLEKYGSGVVYDTPKRSDPWVKKDTPRKSVDYETDSTDHPEHRIYRTSPIKKQSKSKEKSTLPVYMQGSKSLGARIAHGDYMDPQTLLNRKGTSTESVNILINKSALLSESIDDSIYERSVDRLEDLALETASPTLNRSNSVREKRRQIEQKILELNSAPKSMKLKNKTPPPIPAKPNFKTITKSKFTEKSNLPPQSGWVKQVVNKFQ